MPVRGHVEEGRGAEEKARRVFANVVVGRQCVAVRADAGPAGDGGVGAVPREFPKGLHIAVKSVHVRARGKINLERAARQQQRKVRVWAGAAKIVKPSALIGKRGVT